jgi:hypothetical protein
VSDEPRRPEPPHPPEYNAGEVSEVPVGPPAPYAAAGLPGAANEPQPGIARPRSSTGRRRRIVVAVLAVILGASALLCLGGIGVGYFVYHRVSEPDRSTPTVAVDQYLNATFVARDASRARLFTCADPQSIGEGQGLLRDVQDKEARFGAHIAVSWESLKASVKDNSATVDGVVRLNTTIGGNSQEEIQNWRFSVSRRSGWRVCDARRIS